MPGEPPPDPFGGGLLTSAIAQYELYRAWVQAGFTENQALKMIIELMMEQMRRGPAAP